MAFPANAPRTPAKQGIDQGDVQASLTRPLGNGDASGLEFLSQKNEPVVALHFVNSCANLAFISETI